MTNTSIDFSQAIEPFVHEVHTDVMGNVIARKRGGGRSIMLIAHYDVVCLMVTYIDSNGFLYVKPAGGIDVSILPARKVVIWHEDTSVTGIIGKKPIHLMREEQQGKVSYENLWIDIGAKNQEEAKRIVSIGDYVYFCSKRENLINDCVTGSYFDDQLGIEILLEVAKELHSTEVPWDVYYVASNYEEIGMRGAAVAANTIKPNVCICIDVTHATDYPSTNPIIEGEIKLGAGCVLAKGPNIHAALFRYLKNIAEKSKISYQIEVSPYPTGTDANVIQTSGEGIQTAVVSIPCRYMHTPHEICSKTDISSAVKLICQFVRSDSSKESYNSVASEDVCQVR